MRKLLAPAFTPRALKTLQPRIEALVDRLLDEAAGRGAVDLIDDFAAAIPIQLIGDLLGLPQDEREPLRAWSLAILGALEPVLPAEKFEAGIRAVDEFKAYLAGHVRRHAAGDHRDVLSALIAGSELGGAAHEGERLSELELLHNCIFLLNAGHETTTNLIGNGIDLLLRFPDALGGAARRPRADRDGGGGVFAHGELQSARQPPRRGRHCARRRRHAGRRLRPYRHRRGEPRSGAFPDPDRLDIARQPNRHLAFGTGIHACAGMSLARMEAQVGIGKLVARVAAHRAGGRAGSRRPRPLPRVSALPRAAGAVSVRLHATTGGEGSPALLLLHGLGANGAVWDGGAALHRS